jgi:formylglycine-generating enzyme required for sulfatase activity
VASSNRRGDVALVLMDGQRLDAPTPTSLTLAPVGSLVANPFGLHGVCGNVSEWVLAWGMTSDRGASGDGAVIYQRLNCQSHGYRGGSCHRDPVELRSAYGNASQIGDDNRGFRVGREL